MARLIVIEIFRAQRADRDQPIGAGITEFDEQSGAGDAGDAALKGGADAVGEEMRDQTVGGFAFRLVAGRWVREIWAATSVSVSTVSVSGSAPSPSPKPRIKARCTTRSA